MKGKATSFDIAYRAGVSQATVSRALSGSSLVSEETRKRIQAIADELHYKVDKNASSLRRQHSATLALLLFEDPTSDDSLINPFFLSMLGQITRATARLGYDLLISFQQLSDDWHAEYQDSHKADGLILLGYGNYLDARERLERLQSQGTHFVRWGAVVEGPAGLLTKWKLDEVVNQQHFYARHVAPAFDGGAKRVFVVISDAFRFEAAAELVDDLNSRSRVKARLEAMLGVLPSYTALGMASLLPHQRLAYKGNASLDVTVDGQPSSTLEQRSAILAAQGGAAIGRDALMEKGKDKGREFVKPYKVVYVYHDLIDMIGDKRGSETKTFEATANAIKELSELVSFIVNNLNGSTIFVTADHGFMYQESALDEADRHTVEEGMPGVLKPKKRYILGRGMWPMQNAWAGNTATTAGTDDGTGSLDFLVPKGAGRFHFVGGARFVHGSAMPQEIVVPVIVVKESDTEKAKIRQVEVSLLGSSNKVVTNKQRFEFIQTEAVSERVLPVTLLLSIRDGDQSISDEQILTFDSSSPMLDERKRSMMLTLAAGSYDRTKDYFLVARDAKTKAEAWRAPLRIDLAFSNDF